MDYDRHADPQDRNRTMRNEREGHRRSSIFGGRDDRWDDRFDRNWRDPDETRGRSMTQDRRNPRSYRDEHGGERIFRPDRGPESRRRFEGRGTRDEERHFGPDDYRDDLPRDETSHLIASNKVEGTAVYGRDGSRLGTIYNFMVDKRSGRVEYAVMSFGGFLGMGTRYYPVPWQMLTYHTDIGGYEVDLTEDDLREAPSFDERSEPRFDRSYGRDVFAYYGLYY